MWGNLLVTGYGLRVTGYGLRITHSGSPATTWPTNQPSPNARKAKSTCSAGVTTNMPSPRLKTCVISASSIWPARWMSWKSGGVGQLPRWRWMAVPAGKMRGGIVDQAAAGDVGQTLDGDAGLAQALHLGQVAAVRRQQRLAQRPAQLRHPCVQVPTLEDAAGQGEAIGVQPDEASPITALPGWMVEPSMISLRSTTPTIVPTRSNSPARVDARHLGRLAAQQRAAGRLAGRGRAAHHCGHHLRIQLAAGDVVQEEQWPRALHQDVVDAVVDDVVADRVVAAQRRGDLGLGAHAVGRGHQHRRRHALAARPRRTARRTRRCPAAPPGHRWPAPRPSSDRRRGCRRRCRRRRLGR